jgi:hypothetical protein
MLILLFLISLALFALARMLLMSVVYWGVISIVLGSYILNKILEMWLFT